MKLKNILMAAALSLGIGKAQAGNWAEVEAHINPSLGNKVRALGSYSPSKNVDISFFTDNNANQENPNDIENFYLQLRPNYNVGKGFGIVGMLESGNGFKDRARLGVSLTPKLEKKLFTQLRLFPLRSDTNEFRGELFMSREFGPFKVDALTVYKQSEKSKSGFSEWIPTVKLGDKLRLGALLLYSIKDGEGKFQPYALVRYEL